MSDEEELYTEEQVRAYGEEIARQQAQEKSNLHSFFTKVIQNPDTTKTGNVSEEELGNPQISIRGLKELELFCRDIEKNNLWADYFKNMSEIQTSSSLSKEGFLLKLSVTSKKELADVTTKRKKNTGWFRKKSSTED
jgi:hypothetical protein